MYKVQPREAGTVQVPNRKEVFINSSDNNSSRAFVLLWSIESEKSYCTVKFSNNRPETGCVRNLRYDHTQVCTAHHYDSAPGMLPQLDNAWVLSCRTPRVTTETFVSITPKVSSTSERRHEWYATASIHVGLRIQRSFRVVDAYGEGYVVQIMVNLFIVCLS